MTFWRSVRRRWNHEGVPSNDDARGRSRSNRSARYARQEWRTRL
jgi:hypothetical protein